MAPFNPFERRFDAIRHHADLARPSYLIALAYCKLLHGEDCWQWQNAAPGNRHAADALIEEARSQPNYIAGLAMAAVA